MPLQHAGARGSNAPPILSTNGTQTDITENPLDAKFSALDAKVDLNAAKTFIGDDSSTAVVTVRTPLPTFSRATRWKRFAHGVLADATT